MESPLNFLYINFGAGISVLMSDKGESGWRRCLFPAIVIIFSFLFSQENNFPYLYLDIACEQLCFLLSKRYKQKK